MTPALEKNIAPRMECANIDSAVALDPSATHVDDAPLPEVMEEFTRYNVRRFVIADASLQ